MIERFVHGPIAFLPPDTEFNGILEIDGIRLADNTSFTTHVFLEEVDNGNLDDLIKTANYAGSFSVPDDVSSKVNGRAKVLLDISHALHKAEQGKPNFHITFLTQTDAATEEGSIFSYNSVHIRHRVPGNSDLKISANVTCGLAIDHKEPI